MADLVLKNVNKTFGSHAVIPSIDLDIKDGEFVVFVGPSGCGKSTLLRLIAGLEDISSGEILIDGKNVAQTPAADRGVAMVFQSYALYPHMTVRQNLSFGLENIKMPKAEIAARVDAAAKLLQIDQLLDRQPRQLSGGQRQRVAIGRAITRDPKIFLFDEPLSNLDAELRVHMRLEITRLHERLGNTMIYVTHDQIEAMTMADKIVVLRKGVVEQVGAPLELYNRPRNTFVAGFIGSPRMNMIDGAFQAGDGAFRFDAQGLPPVELSHEGAEVARQSGKLGIRPEDLVIGDSGWPVEITVAEQHGANSYLHGTLANGEAILIHKPGQIAVTRGDILHVTPAASKWHVFDQSELRIEARPEGIRRV